MGTLIFFIAAAGGLILTTFWVGSYRNKPQWTPHGDALKVAIGLSLTWLVSTVAPQLVPLESAVSWGTLVLPLVLALCVGAVLYAVVRFMWWRAGRRSK